MWTVMLAAALAGETHLDLLGGTTLPVDVGGRLQLETPGRFRVGVDVGTIPGAYVDLVNEIVVAFEGYDPVTAELIASALERSVTVGVDVGWRPWPKEGAQFWAGYLGLFAQGGLTGTEALEAVTGVPSDRVGAVEVPLRATVHMVQTGLSWEQVWLDHLVLRVDLGGAFTVAAKTEIEPERAGALLSTAVEGYEDYLDGSIEGWFHTPLVGVSLGARFF